MEAHEAPGQSLVEFHGLVCRSLANDLFDVRLADGRSVLAHLAPQARLTALRIGAGDHVRVTLARYDHTRGRITGRAPGPVRPGGDVGVGT
ncbi:MAG: translation initiation factor IF-1 [Chloroflexota bacterium]|nr:translation initiation factor IF-1 [Chloroflexota bacterium]